jgi:hypothetical protein
MSAPTYLLFAGDDYYPDGGWEDYRGAFGSVESAKAAVRPSDDWAHVVSWGMRAVVEEMHSRMSSKGFHVGEYVRVWEAPRA